jgi:hypothetical protein
MADGQYLYLSASWADSTNTIAKNLWTFDGAVWSKSGNEDRLGFVWDLGLNGSDGASCVTMCHGDGLMRTNTGNVDAWHWKSARGNTFGVADDKVWGTDDRHSDAGTSAYSDNVLIGSGFPTFMATSDPDANLEFLVNTADALAAWDPFEVSPHTVEVAVPFDSNASFANGSTVPGYVLRIPSGDRASVEAAGKHENGMWTVEFRRLYSTGSEDDFEVVPGSSVEFTHEIFDNTGGSHPNDGFDATPFNPSTTIEFQIFKKEFVSLKVFDLMGREVATLVNKEMDPGKYQVLVDGRNLASGIYFYNVTVNNFSQNRKMILMK